MTIFIRLEKIDGWKAMKKYKYNLNCFYSGKKLQTFSHRNIFTTSLDIWQHWFLHCTWNEIDFIQQAVVLQQKIIFIHFRLDDITSSFLYRFICPFLFHSLTLSVLTFVISESLTGYIIDVSSYLPSNYKQPLLIWHLNDWIYQKVKNNSALIRYI